MSFTNTFDYIKTFIGIDVSKQWLDCIIRPSGDWTRCENQPNGFDQLDRWLRERDVDPQTSVICMENTGVYDDRVLQALTEKGWICCLEKTTILEKVTPDHHRKDDRFDAAGLAEYAERYLDKLNVWEPVDEEIELLRQLFSERRRLVTQRAAVKSKCTQSLHHTQTSSVVAQSWQQQLTFYTEHIDQIESRIRTIIKGHQGMTTYDDLIKSIPGIGEVTSWLWLILFYGQTDLDYKKIASRFGYAPHSKRSGTSVKGKTRSSGHGASEVRQCLCMAVRSASTHCEKFKKYKQKKLDEDKIWPIVRNNLANKLIKTICAIWNSEQPYDPNHTSRFDRQKKLLNT